MNFFTRFLESMQSVMSTHNAFLKVFYQFAYQLSINYGYLSAHVHLQADIHANPISWIGVCWGRLSAPPGREGFTVFDDLTSLLFFPSPTPHAPIGTPG